MEDDRAPICPRCGVTMLPSGLSARSPESKDSAKEWVCVECEETAEPD